MKKTYWCVESRFDDRGRVKARIYSRECGEKPQNTCRETAHEDIYEDWFNGEDGARAFLKEARAA